VCAAGTYVSGFPVTLSQAISFSSTYDFNAKLPIKIPESLIVFPGPLEVITLSAVVNASAAITSPTPKPVNLSSTSSLV
jgi:hypothetical protein